MTTTPEDLPDDIAALQAALVVERAKRIEEAVRAARVEAELALAKARASAGIGCLHDAPTGWRVLSSS